MTEEQRLWLEQHPDYAILGQGQVAHGRLLLFPDGTTQPAAAIGEIIPGAANRPTPFPVGIPGRAGGPNTGGMRRHDPQEPAGAPAMQPAPGRPPHGGHRNIDGRKPRKTTTETPASAPPAPVPSRQPDPDDTEQFADPRGYIRDWNPGGGQNNDGEPLKPKDTGPLRKD